MSDLITWVSNYGYLIPLILLGIPIIMLIGVFAFIGYKYTIDDWNKNQQGKSQ